MSVPTSLSPIDDYHAPLTTDLDEIFHILRNERRRILIRVAPELELDTEYHLKDLATFVIAKEEGVDEQKLSSKDRKRGYTSLLQSHIPTMENAGLVTFNKARKRVAFHSSILTLNEMLTIVDRDLGIEEVSA